MRSDFSLNNNVQKVKTLYRALEGFAMFYSIVSIMNESLRTIKHKDFKEYCYNTKTEKRYYCTINIKLIMPQSNYRNSSNRANIVCPSA